MIWTPKPLLFRIKKYSEIFRSVRLEPMGIGNWLRIEAVGLDGRSRWLTDWFHNNITDTGLNLCATSSARYNACQVGTGNATPTDSDTSLQTFLAGTATRVNLGESTQVTTSPYYVQRYYRYDFATGAVVGNVSELMIGTASSGGSCFSRELVRDSGGSPTTVTVLSSEALRVHYKIRHYPPMDDVAGAIMISATAHDTVRRACNLTTAAGQAAWTPGADTASGAAPLIGSASSPRLSTSDLASITTSIDGTGDSGSAVNASYSSGSFSRLSTFTWTTSQANQNSRRLYFRGGLIQSSGGIFGDCGCAFQVRFDPTINKNNTQVLTLEAIVSWGRYTP